MRKILFILFFALGFSKLLLVANEMPLLQGMGNLKHPVTTHNPLAQQFFDQGLTLIYAFNHDAAFNSFERAAQIDPNLAMAYWGMALSLGQNINQEITPEKELKAYELIQRALSLIDSTSDNEKAYVYALSTRYTNRPNPDLIKLRINYKQAMEKLMAQYPEDLDAATLYAESVMNLRPWRLWTNEREPVEGTLEVVAVLESVLKRDPMHLGANHYYIHAMEGSKHPEYALMSAERLRVLIPESGHILHMPAHIFILVGDYEQAAASNEEAVKADLRYIQQFGISGFYPVHYLSHNYFFLSRAYLLMGRFEDSLKAASELQELYRPYFSHMPGLEYYTLNPMQVMVFFHRWSEILNTKRPPEEMHSAISFWHFARSMAYAGTNRKDLAEKERAIFLDSLQRISNQEKLGNNEARTIFKIADLFLQAKLAKLSGNGKKAIELLKQAVAVQDQLYYNEPPDWFFPIRETLGAELILQNNPQEAREVFKVDLDWHPRNPYSLYGLLLALLAENKITDAFWVKQELERAWKNASVELNLQLISL